MRVLAILAAIVTAALLSGCGGNPMPINLNLKGSDYCDIARPVRWHQKDTKDTITQVRRENAKHARVCAQKRKK